MRFQTWHTGFGHWNPTLMIFSLICLVFFFVAMVRLCRFFLQKKGRGVKLSQKILASLEQMPQMPELESTENAELNPYFQLLQRLDSSAFAVQMQLLCVMVSLLLCVAIFG